MSKISKGKLPVNARIDIDYTGKKPKVKFSYPKKDVVLQNIVGPHTYILFVLLAILYCLPTTIPHSSEMPRNCTANITQTMWSINSTINSRSMVINSSYVNNITINCDNRIIVIKHKSIYYLPYAPFYIADNKKENNMDLCLYYISIFAAFISINWLLTIVLTKCKWYQKFNPKFAAGGKNKVKRYMKFLPKDVENNVIIIPKFKNVELNYNATGQFSKYLERMIIRELQYHRIKKGKINKKLIKDVFTWYAIFYFKEKPKSGFLEVTYQ